MSLPSRAWAAALVASWALSALPASAAEPSDVEDLIRRGGELRKQGNDAAALPLYQRAYHLGQSPRTAAQLGLVEVQLGYRIEAEDHLAEALAARGDNWIEKYRKVLDEQLHQVKAGIGEVVIVGSPAGAEVSVNGKLRGQLPLVAPIRLVAGPALVEMSADGYTPASATVNVRGQSQERVMLTLARSAVAGVSGTKVDVALTSSATSEASWSTGKIAGVAAIIGGGVAILGGGTLLLLDKHETCSTPSGGMCIKRTQTRGPGWGLVGVGAASILVGVVVVHSSSSSEVVVGASPSSVFIAGRF
jgi:hypothetical protein